jgi:tRNA(fMet)-specific endonuclease VapC
MSLYVLDSDILCLIQEGDLQLKSRVESYPTGQVAVSVITVEEQLRGWFDLVRRAKKPLQLAFAYDQLARSVSDLSQLRILSYSVTAIDTYKLLQKNLRVRANDLRIAAIALEHKAIVVTRNVRDFVIVPGLTVEDWTRPSS